MKFAIVVVGYNREKPLAKILNSVTQAHYGNEVVDLIVSLDYSDVQKKLITVTDSVKWNYGEKIVRTYSERQGLRKHILQCGDLTEKYDAVVILEDDLIVSESYFEYVSQCVNYYDDNDSIAGISLYNHRINPGNGRFFEAAYDGKDTYFMQYAQSWGQCWTKRMWNDFKSWYEVFYENNFESIDIPQYVKNWGNQSWLKYYIAYCSAAKKYYVYPYHSLTTNCTEVGTHNKMVDSSYQVPLLYGKLDREFYFSNVNNGVKYDAYFERIFDNASVAGLKGKIQIDLYGLKYDHSGYDYLISTNSYPYHIIETFALQYRPQEINLLSPEIGKCIRVYDLKIKSKNKKNNRYELVKYDMRAMSIKMSWIHFIYGLLFRLRLFRRK